MHFVSTRLVPVGVPPGNTKMRRVPWPKWFGKRWIRETSKRHYQGHYM